MRLPREVLKRDGFTLHPFFVQKAVAGKVERFADDRHFIVAKIVLIVLIFLAASWVVSWKL